VVIMAPLKIIGLMSSTHYLPPTKLKLRESADGGLLLDLDGQTVALAAPKRALPVSDPDRYIVLTNLEGEEIGVVRAVDELEPHSRSVLQEALKRVYVMDRITRVLEVEKEALSGQTRWRVEIAISEEEMEDTRPVASILKRALGNRGSNQNSETTEESSSDDSNAVQKVRWLKRETPVSDGDEDSDEETTETIVSRVVTEEREFYISGQEDVKTARYPQIFIVDTEGHHYEITNCEELDLASRHAAERYI